MNWLTIAVIVFLVVMAGYGAAKGLVRMIMSFAAVLLTVLIVSIICEPLGEIVKEQTTMYESIEAGIGTYVGQSVGNVADSFANGTQELLDKMMLPELLKESLLRGDTPGNYQSMGVSDAASYVTAWLTNLVYSALIFVGAFIIVRFVLWIVTLILNAVMRLPVLKQLNSLAGAILALAMGVVLLWIGCMIVTAGAATSWGQEAMRLIEESTVLNTIYNYNYLMSDILIH